MPSREVSVLFMKQELYSHVDAESPNQSPEPTAVGAGSSAIAVHAVSRRGLSFFR